MDLQSLREFIVLAETGSYSEAANRLYISQSTLSKHIKRLELELNVALFDRTTRKVELNEYGRLLLPYANQMLHVQDQFSSALLQMRNEERGRLEIGSIPALAQYHITDSLVRYKKRHPEFQLHVTQTSSEELRELLRSGRLELAFIRETEQITDEFARIPYAVDELAAILPKTHPLASQGSIRLSKLAQEEFIMLDQTSMLYELSVAACRESGFTPHIAYTDHKIENIIDFVRKEMGVGLLMLQLALYSLNPDIRIMELEPKVSTQINVCYLKNRELSAAAKYFLDCLMK